MVNNLNNSIYAIISTFNRPKLLERAIKSVMQQTRKPDYVLVIQEKNDPSFNKNKDIVNLLKKRYTTISVITNHRTDNLSGAVNSGLEHLLTISSNPNNDFIAILDDDDYWDEGYLEKCEEEVVVNNSDWVITGLIRHHSKNECEKLNIPKHICIEDFLSGNPHVQGSNIFIRFTKALETGGFDEALDSTTDRDFCIRLLFSNRITYSIINQHLVHHDAFSSNERLSKPNSVRKKQGLNAFYKKYNQIMSNNIRTAYKKRAETIFACKIDENQLFQNQTVNSLQKSKDVANIPDEKTSKFALVIGFIASNRLNLTNLLEDINKLSLSAHFLKKVVIVDNLNSNFKYEEIADSIKYANYEVIIKSKEEIYSDIKKLKFGEFVKSKEDFYSISGGRTVLHSYLYEESVIIPGAVVWVIDDDMRLKYLDSNSREIAITASSLYEAVLECKKKGVSIAIGGITGDPPIPHYSLIRTQLIDLFYNLLILEDKNEKRNQSEFQIKANLQNTLEMKDYYYDYSNSSFTHLETPFWYNFLSTHHTERITNLINAFSNIANGKAITRPVRVASQDMQKKGRILVRGGNTLVVNLETLKRFPNISPRFEGKSFRRSDTIWCILNQHLDKVYISQFPISLLQERTSKSNKQKKFDNLHLDFLGSSFMSALDDFYKSKNKNEDIFLANISLYFSEKDISTILKFFELHLERKLSLFLITSYRIRGLVEAILKKYKRITIEFGIRIQNKFVENLEIIKHDFDIDKISAQIKETRSLQKDVIKRFLQNIKSYTKSYRKNNYLSIMDNYKIFNKRDPHYKKALDILKTATNLSEFKFLAQGREGLIFRKNDRVFKLFYKGLCTFHPKHLDFLRSKMLLKNSNDNLVPLKHIYELEGELIFETILIDGKKYSGGNLNELRRLVISCKNNKIVLSNIHQDNILQKDNRLIFIDIGRSIVPYSDHLFLNMCRRVFLLYKFHYREDLPVLMTRSLYDHFIPELFGFEYFLNSLEVQKISKKYNPEIIKIIPKDNSLSIFDFGCGTGKIIENLSQKGHPTYGYDIDKSIITNNKKRNNKVKYLDVEDFKEIQKKKMKFDIVICTLVLCIIEDTKEVERILEEIRGLVKRNGKVIISICNPLNSSIEETETRIILQPNPNYNINKTIQKTIKQTSNQRFDYHRPVEFYKKNFHKFGFEIVEVKEIESTDVKSLNPASDFIIFNLKPLKQKKILDVTLLIKASAMEWKTIDFQVKHLVGQLEGPEQFSEIVVITDNFEGPYLRQFAEPNQDEFMKKLHELKQQGYLDRIISAPLEKSIISRYCKKWFDCEVENPHSVNRQHVFTSIYGFEACNTEYVLQLDSDCIISRTDRNVDYLSRMVEVFEKDTQAVTVAFNIANTEDIDYHINDLNPYRTEVSFCMLNLIRMKTLLPIPNKLENDRLRYSWHESLDKKIEEMKLASYRGGSKEVFYVHISNELKKDINFWYTVVKSVERNYLYNNQIGQVELVGSLSDWLPERNEPIVILLRGKSVDIVKVRRSLNSLLTQDVNNWGAIILDAGSKNEMEDFIENVILPENNNFTYFRNWNSLTPIENILIANNICTNQDSIIVHLDLDDALIRKDVLKIIQNEFDKGVDVTVGSMLRTDKNKHYPVKFDNPRSNRGGNVWQHLRTYRKYLFDAIEHEDFKIANEWIDIAEDWAFMLPIIEMAKNPKWKKKILYYYEPDLQRKHESRKYREQVISEIIRKKPYNRAKLKGEEKE